MSQVARTRMVHGRRVSRLVAVRPDDVPAPDTDTDSQYETADIPAVIDRPLRWWRELLLASIFYAVYSFVRNTQGSAMVSRAVAEANALRIITVEQFFGVYHERWLQQLFVGAQPSMVVWNFFYGTFHFVVTAFVLVFLFRRFPERYRVWRNALAATTALALIGFAMYPLLPPRLLPSSHGFIDSLKVYGSLWSFDSGSMQVISNQYAAMPSLHFAWSLWSGLALFPVLRRPWAKVLAVLYPVLTLLAIVITANHFILDALAGAVALGGGWLLGRAMYRRSLGSARRRPVAIAATSPD
ncbi:MAG TPA: phosphatase PAP2 family protein [Acidimicrobiales bacterium]|nr:phosphatase PAP2 family protein [Acidimicrobiales bacterium]